MTEKYLRNLYKKWLKFSKHIFFIDRKKYSTSFKKLTISQKEVEKFYDNYYRVPFFIFLSHIKSIIYSKTVFDFILNNASEDWKLWPYLRFLEKEKIIKVKKSGTVSLIKKELANVLPKPQTEKEIKEKIEKKLKVKVKKRDFVVDLFKKFQAFKVKSGFDQMPISQGSAIFVVRKILEKMPFNNSFLFIGDDDFISVILTLVSPKIECLVVDIDDQLLNCINSLASQFNLKIKTKKIDLTKNKKPVLGGKFTGFLTNPVYTLGAREFIEFGKRQLGKDGGFGFLEMGDEAMGNRFLFLQDFFTKNNLIIEEIIPGKIYYPFISLYKEDEEILRRMSTMIEKKTVKKSPRLGASLYIFKYVPFKLEKLSLKGNIYAYL